MTSFLTVVILLLTSAFAVPETRAQLHPATPADLRSLPQENGYEVTDLDADGIAESAFLYMLACRSDVSPAVVKLILHEGSTKLAVRGTTRPRGADDGRETRLDPAFGTAPEAFRSFALRRWERFADEDLFPAF